MRLKWWTVGAALWLILNGFCSTHAAVPWNNPSGNSPGFFSWENGQNETGLFGDPIAVGNALSFFPVGFTAQSTGGGSTQLSDKLSVDLTCPFRLAGIYAFSVGDFSILGSGTNTLVTAAGTLTVTPITFNPSQPPGTKTDTLHTNPAMPRLSGSGPWQGIAATDFLFASNVTKVHIELESLVRASSDPNTTAFIESKLAEPLTIVFIPEPATVAVLMCGALLILRPRRTF
jgi:hypothetical protein